MTHPKALLLADVPVSYRNLLWHSDATVELRDLYNYKLAYREWYTKTEWVQNTATSKELGLHRADVIKGRFVKLENQRDQLLEALKDLVAYSAATDKWHSRFDFVFDKARALITRSEAS